MNLNKLLSRTAAIIMAFLFLYAGASKLYELKKFFYQLGKSPLIPYGWNKATGIGVLFIEFLIVYLVYKQKIKASLVISFTLMSFFSLYIGYLLYYSYYVPCSCGGILGNLSWKTHLLINIFFTVIPGAGYLLSHQDEK